jgi:hypothetical protein
LQQADTRVNRFLDRLRTASLQSLLHHDYVHFLEQETPLETTRGETGRQDLGGATNEDRISTQGVLALIAALLFPGAGHAMLGKWVRAVAISAILLSTFGLGVLLEGRVYVVAKSLLSLFYSFGDAGLGLVYGFCLVAGYGLDVQAGAPTFEYGSNLILVAGLLNYLVALDAYDIGAGRKS